MNFTCPTDTRPPSEDVTDPDIVGCGQSFDAQPDAEGQVDCPNCGIWFTP